jgi:hypothetical protein
MRLSELIMHMRLSARLSTPKYLPSISAVLCPDGNNEETLSPGSQLPLLPTCSDVL